MIKRPLGQTGEQLSIVGFGGMRFNQPDDLDQSAALVRYAYERGINHFDTAPLYCNNLSQKILGHALTAYPRDSFYLSTKCNYAAGDSLRKSLEASLKKLQVDYVDFFYIWYLLTPDDWQQRLQQGAVEAALKARDEGLIRHLLCSSHMEGDGLIAVLSSGYFEGVLLGYNALNFPYRRSAVDAAGDCGLGVISMNPLAGGLIPQNPERFAFLKSHPQESVTTAALRFNLSHPAITSALVGFSDTTEIDEAVAAVDQFTPCSDARQAQLLDHIHSSFDGLCTGCGYCLPCPQGIPIPKFLDTYNHLLLSDGDRRIVDTRFRLHWNIDPQRAASCTACGLCEQRCTQHLPIIKRLKELITTSASGLPSRISAD